MSKLTSIIKSCVRLVLPAVLVVVVAGVAGAVLLVYDTSRPRNPQYLVTPAKYAQLSTRAAQVTEETWQNRDGSTARGWLLRGAENAPAVILFHKYEANRSYVLNLGVKLNESTNFTVLMPDQRAHGENPSIQSASFGGCETEDATSAIEFLRGLKTPEQLAFVGRDLGVYGVEMGALVAMSEAAKDKSIKAIAVDSVPQNSDAVLKGAVERRFPFASIVTTQLAEAGTRLYYFDGCYQREPVCDTARGVDNRNVLLLGGIDAQDFQESTMKLSKCLPSNNKIEAKLDL
ncbi:MAG: hypothetical protein ABJB40_06805, partial [Acidobacteriota bacterium]